MARSKQPAGLARAREQRKRAELDERSVLALERIAAALERFAVVALREGMAIDPFVMPCGQTISPSRDPRRFLGGT